MHNPDSAAIRLRRFNADVLRHGLAIVQAHERPGAPPYARPVGAHLRHVIEHYEALLHPPEPGVVDYDARPRDSALEHDPAVARQRLLALLLRLGAADLALDAPVQVRGRGGLSDTFGFGVVSSIGRELVFAASHAIHHHAMLTAHCNQHGIVVDQRLGQAPATVAHARAAAVRNAAAGHTKLHPNQEPTCTPHPATA
jgi:hypothetical protein